MFKQLKSWFSAPALPLAEFVSDNRAPEFTFTTNHASSKPKHQRNFQAANINRLTASFASNDIALNTLLESQLGIMRARSRNNSRNTPGGRRFLTLCKNNIVGSKGFKLQSRCGEWVNGKWVLDLIANQTIEEHFDIWCKAEHCDVTGQSTFAQICRLCTGEGLARDGEFLVKEIVGTKDTPYRYQLQVLAIDRLDTNYRAQLANGNTVRMGVERTAAGRPVAYYVLVKNPNDALSMNNQTRERIDAKDIIHKFVRTDPEQLRGYPWMHAITTGQNMLHMFQEAAVQAAVVGASNMAFFETPAPGDAAYIPPADGEAYGSEVADDIEADGTLVQDAIGGSMRVLPAGWKVSKFDPDYPNASFDPFVQNIKKDMASGVDVAHHNLSGDMSGVNYSSARIAELNERDCWRDGQQFMIDNFAMRVVNRWLELSLLAGALKMPNGSPLPAAKIDKFKAKLSFTARGWDWVDPLKEANAAKIAIEEGLTTRTQVVASKGGDFEENVIELERELQLLKDHGIELGPKVQTSAINDTQDLNNSDGGNSDGKNQD